MAEKSKKESLVDGCFLTWVQVTEHFRDEGSITERTKSFRKDADR